MKAEGPFLFFEKGIRFRKGGTMKDMAKACIAGTVGNEPEITAKGSCQFELLVETRTAKVKIGILAKGEAAEIKPRAGDYVVIPGGEIFIPKDGKYRFSVFVKEKDSIFIVARDDGFISADEIM